MNEYISREEAIHAIKSLESSIPAKDNYAKGYDAALGRVLIAVREVPPVTNEQPVKHGRWEEIEEYGGWGDTYFRCSICGDEWDLDAGTPVENGMKYCPSCGAKMDGGAE